MLEQPHRDELLRVQNEAHQGYSSASQYRFLQNTSSQCKRACPRRASSSDSAEVKRSISFSNARKASAAVAGSPWQAAVSSASASFSASLTANLRSKLFRRRAARLIVAQSLTATSPRV